MDKKQLIFVWVLSFGFLSICLILPFAFAENYRTVTKVLDGDTLILDGDETIRLIGIDTPELHHPSKPVMYYAQEAYKFVKELCEGKRVKLEYDDSNSPNKHLDKYGRTLAYIYLDNGTFVNAEIIKQGYGFCYVRFPFKYLEEFRKYQRQAMEESRGLWAETIQSPEVSNLIMNYEKLDDKGKEMARDYLEYLTIKYRKESDQ